MLLSRDPSLEILIAVGIIVLVAFPFHEFAHALAAYRLGDSTARLFGRLTLDPRAHLDPMGAILLLLVGFGWAKPTPVSPFNLRGGRAGEAIVALAGPISNFALAAAAALPLRFILSSGVAVPEAVINVLHAFLVINLLLMVFNLIPIPPLDGSKVLFAAMDPQTEYRYRPVIEQYGPFLLLLLIVLGAFGGANILGTVIFTVLEPIYELLLGRPLGRFL